MTAKTDISKCLSLLFGKLKLCIFLSFIVLCLLQPTANYDLAIIEDYLAGNAKIKISIKKQNGVVVIFGKRWQLLLTGSAVPRIQSLQLNRLGWVQLLNYLSGRADDKFCHDRVAIKTKLSVQSKAKLDLNLSAFYQLSSFSSL